MKAWRAQLSGLLQAVMNDRSIVQPLAGSASIQAKGLDAETHSHIMCPLCDTRNVKLVFDAAPGRDEFRCAACGAFFFWPLPSEEEQKSFYESQWAQDDTQYRRDYCDPEQQAINLRLNFMPRLDLLAQRGYMGKLLDVGCSVGTFLRAAKERGWSVEGLDLGESACALTAAEVGCPVHCGTLDTLELPDGTYDVIHASQVIEHVLDPRAFLSAAWRLLKPGGALILATPIIEPSIYCVTHHIQSILVPFVSRGRERPYPWAVHYPFHVILHSPQSLRQTIESQGFCIVHERKIPWLNFQGMNLKWRIFYHGMNALSRALRAGMNMDVLAVRAEVCSKEDAGKKCGNWSR